MKDGEDTFYLNKKMVDERRRLKEKNEREKSAQRLESIVKKKMQTLMIGALEAMEKNLGDMWGHKNPNRTATQDKIAERWEEARTQILNLGNRLIHNIEEEMSYYDIVWLRYQYKLPFISSDELQDILKKNEDKDE
jgi:hypothetical protein